MKWLQLFFLITTGLYFLACSPSAIDKDSTLDSQYNRKIEKIAPQPLVYHDSAEILELSSGYGKFGSYKVKIKNIPNTRYDYNPSYKNLNLQTTLYYPTDISTPRPTLFFYSGYNAYNPDSYKGLLYFVASKGYNIVFLTCPGTEIALLREATRDAIKVFSTHIDKTKVGFLGHSMGAGVSFWLINELSELGSNARLLFPMASGYTLFNTKLMDNEQTIQLPGNTKMIQQVYAKDYTTDVRISIDLFLNSSINTQAKDYMFIYGDENHSSDHESCMSKANYHYDSFMQRTIFRPLDALMDQAFKENSLAREQLKKELREDSYFNPYIDDTPHIDIRQYILPEESYPFNCSEGGTVESIRKDYCDALGL